MKVTDFIQEWDRTHSCPPSFQDAIDWVERQIAEKDSRRTWTIVEDDIYDFPCTDFHLPTTNIDKQGLIDYAKAKIIEKTGKYFFALEYQSLLLKLTSDQIVRHLKKRFGAEIIETTGIEEGARCIWFDPEAQTDAEYTIDSCGDRENITSDSIITLSNEHSETMVFPGEIFMIMKV